jgi:ankyrin repeat protein
MSTGPASSLDHYRKSARRLKKAYFNGEAEAVARTAAHVDTARPPRHADFLHVIAREAGHESWPRLKFAIETASFSRSERAARLKQALYFGQHWVTEKLLADDPTLKDDNFGLQVALFDLETVRSILATDAGAATRQVGVRTPILHLAFSKNIHRRPELAPQMLAIAGLLVANGADVNDGYPDQPGDKHLLSALYGALCHADNYELGRWLLERGANPNDDESLYHATELGHSRALELLLKYGGRPDGTNALPRALDFGDVTKVRLLLDAGADPNITEADHPSGQPMNSIPALHQAARRGCSEKIVELLLTHGADPDAEWEGHTAHAMAAIYGNLPVTAFLARRGHARELTPNEKVLGDCAKGKSDPGRLDIARLSREDKSLLTRLAILPGKLDHMKALIAAGLDPDETDEMGLLPLHVAGWNGLADEMDYFLSLGPDLTRKNHFGGDALDTVVHGSEFAPKRPEADHISCARLLLEAGCPIDPHSITSCGNEEMAQFLEDWLAEPGSNAGSRALDR